MYIREDLVYNKHTGKMIGFTDLGNINNHLLLFERMINEEQVTAKPLAKSILAIMVKGLFTWEHLSISWEHLQQLYRQDTGKATGLSMIPKLKYEHIELTSFSKMRVDLAAQVCNNYTVIVYYTNHM